MTPLQNQQITAEIAALNADYWYEVDRHDGAKAHTFFVEGGEFSTSMKKRVGHQAIIDFYNGRQAGEKPRTARHLITNHRVQVQDADNATADWILVLHAADGVPVLPSEPAIMIADVRDVCRREADGRWRYVSRVITGVFKSSAPTTG